MQVPAVSSDSVLPETEQIDVVVEEKVTVRPEVAVAVRVTCVPAYWVPVMGVKVMVCGALAMLKLCMLPVIDVKSVPAVALAVSEQVPKPT